MPNPEDTQPNKWAQAEAAVDDVLAVVLKSPLTWVIVAAWSAVCFVAGAVVF